MIEELAGSLKTSVEFVRKSVEDLSAEQMVLQPPGAPNHAMWTLGHIIFSCQGMAVELGAEPWLADDWESTFGYGSEPSPDRSCYLTKAEMLRFLDDSASRLCDSIRMANESLLGKTVPDETLPTMGHMLLHVVAAHTGYHAGQLAVWRRAIGMPSAGVFI